MVVASARQRIPDELIPRLEASHRIDHELSVLLEKLEAQLARQIAAQASGLFGYPSERIARRVVQILLRDDWKTLNRAVMNHAVGIELPKFAIDLPQSRVRVEYESGQFRIRQRPLGFFRNLGMIVGVWAWCVFKSFSRSFRRSGERAVPFNLFRNPGLEAQLEKEEIESDLKTFFKSGPVPVFREPGTWIVQAAEPKSSADSSIVFTEQPLLALCVLFPWTFSSAAVLAVSVFGSLLPFLVCVLRCPSLVLLRRDFGFHPLLETLDRYGAVKNIVLTNSSFLDQEIWLTDLPRRHLKSHMVWYSTNTQPFRWNCEHLYSEMPSTSRIEVDRAWVWHEDHAKWVREQTRTATVTSVGPIMYKGAELGAWADHEAKFDVLIFDVTPIREDWFKENVWPNGFYYFAAPNMEQFVTEVIVEARAKWGPSSRIALKHKREYHPVHDRKYIAFIEKCEQEGICIAPPTANVFDLVRSSRSVVVTPFSSPAYVADAMGVPAVFFDPLGLVARPDWLTNRISFADSAENLRNFFEVRVPAVELDPKRLLLQD